MVTATADNGENAERFKAVRKLRSAIMFWESFQRQCRKNDRAYQHCQITLVSLRHTLQSLEKGEIDMKLIPNGGK